MKTIIKSGVKKVVEASVNILGRSTAGRYVDGEIIAGAMERTRTVTHRGLSLTLSVPNNINRFRADTFSEKEPETLDWIDAMPQGSILWDIGANVGLYACYAAKKRGCRVFAFEPSVFNLELLARNIYQNDLGSLVTIIPLPLSDSIGVSSLNMTSTDWGGALSTFGQSYGHDGQPMKSVFKFSTVGITMQDAVDRLDITPPDFVKIDVDGIEHLILKGGQKLLSRVRSVLIEINDAFREQADEANAILLGCGLRLVEKRQWDGQTLPGSIVEQTFNQIWVRTATEAADAPAPERKKVG